MPTPRRGQKRGPFCRPTPRRAPKRAAFYTPTPRRSPKRGPFCRPTPRRGQKHAAFYRPTPRRTPKHAAFCRPTPRRGQKGIVSGIRPFPRGIYPRNTKPPNERGIAPHSPSGGLQCLPVSRSGGVHLALYAKHLIEHASQIAYFRFIQHANLLFQSAFINGSQLVRCNLSVTLCDEAVDAVRILPDR